MFFSIFTNTDTHTHTYWKHLKYEGHPCGVCRFTILPTPTHKQIQTCQLPTEMNE